MNSPRWTFLSNHGRVFCYLAKYPRSTIEGLARDAGLSVAGVHRIIDDLEHEGYVSRERVGRRNRYTVHPELPMRHRLERNRTVADMLLNDGDGSARTPHASMLAGPESKAPGKEAEPRDAQFAGDGHKQPARGRARSLVPEIRAG